MAKQPSAVDKDNPRVGGCWCNQFEENMWRKDVCMSCFHKKADHTNHVGMCNFRKPPATKAAQEEASRKASMSSTLPPTISAFSEPAHSHYQSHTQSHSMSSSGSAPTSSSKRVVIQSNSASNLSATASSPSTGRRPSNASNISARFSKAPSHALSEPSLSASGSAVAHGQEPVEMCLRLMRQLFVVVDLNMDDKYVKEFWTKCETDIRNRKGTRHWLSPNTLRLMESLRAEVDTFVDHQKRIQKIILMQSLVRAKVAKKKVAGLRGYLLSPHRERNFLFRELIKNERMYISRLSLMVKGYMQPLKSTKLLSFSHILPIDDINAIFSNTEVLLKVHTGILGEFEMLLDKWPVIDQIGSVFLRKAPELKGYGEYVKNFKTALDTLIRSQENNQKFAQFLAERGVASDDPGLMALISCPLNQISQYEILLERLSKATPTWHPDSAHLSAASQIMRESYKLIQEAINQSHDRAKILDVQRRLMSNQLEHDLATQDRVFITEGAVSVIEKKMKKSRYYFLFNDILLVCKQHKNQFKVKSTLTLKDLIIEEFANAQQLPSAFDPLCCCNLIVPKAKLTVLFASKTEKSDLVLKLRTIVEKLNPNTKVFGLSLVELQKREKASASTVPSILDKMAQRIKTDVEAEGLFRISCSNANLLELRDKLEKDDDVDFSKFEVHVVTSAMKLFFREMPEPLLTFVVYDDILAAADITSTETRIAALKTLVRKLPKPNYEVLVFICTFLRFVAEHSEINKMTLSNLAIVFGPNLIKPPVVTIESTLMIPKANSIFDDMLTYFDQIVELKQ